MAKKKAVIEFKEGKKIIKYPGGIVREQTKEDLEKYKQHLIRRKENIDRQVTLVDKDLMDIENSKVV